MLQLREPLYIIESLLLQMPTGALDSDTSKIIMNIFTSLNRDNHTTIILVTHDRKVAEKLIE